MCRSTHASNHLFMVTLRLTRWLLVQERQGEFIMLVSNGLQDVIESKTMSARRWTVTTSKTVSKNSKPAQVVCKETGEVLMDRYSLHSLLNDLAGVSKGDQAVRARLAQVGENIDRLHNILLHLQKDTVDRFGLSLVDSMRGMCFTVYHSLLSRFTKDGQVLPFPEARQLFDEFAGLPAAREAEVFTTGMGKKRGLAGGGKSLGVVMLGTHVPTTPREDSIMQQTVPPVAQLRPGSNQKASPTAKNKTLPTLNKRGSLY
jgi:hypothetical protein